LGKERLGIPMSAEAIDQTIRLVRGHRVMLDADLARLYGVQTKALNQAVKRNRTRFPPDIMFQLR
jgi:ORF6N domain